MNSFICVSVLLMHVINDAASLENKRTVALWLHKECEHEEVKCPGNPNHPRAATISNDAQFKVDFLSNQTIVGNLSWSEKLLPDLLNVEYFARLKLITDTDSNTAPKCFRLKHTVKQVPPVQLNCVQMIPDASAKILVDVISQSCDVIADNSRLGDHRCNQSTVSSSVVNAGKRACEFSLKHIQTEITVSLQAEKAGFACFLVELRCSPFSMIDLTIHSDTINHPTIFHVPVSPDDYGSFRGMPCHPIYDVTSDMCYAKVLLDCPGRGPTSHFLSDTFRCLPEYDDPRVHLSKIEVQTSTPPVGITKTHYTILLAVIVSSIILILTVGCCYLVRYRRWDVYLCKFWVHCCFRQSSNVSATSRQETSPENNRLMQKHIARDESRDWKEMSTLNWPKMTRCQNQHRV